jgi:hypothetical protein
MKFEEGKFYRTRDGRKAKIFLIQNYDMLGAVLWNGLWQHCEWYNCGRKLIGGDKLDLIEEWKEKVKRTVWVNVYQTERVEIFLGAGHWNSQSKAMEHASNEYTYLGAHPITVEVEE